MKTIFLHIGHGKTGTSATQMVLGKHANLLLKCGIYYKEPKNAIAARLGKIRSGNVYPQHPDWIDKQILVSVEENCGFDIFLFSSEEMIGKYEELCEFFLKYRSTYKFRLILAVRNPLGILASHYNQSVKAKGYFGSIEDFEVGEMHLITAANALKKFEDIEVGVFLINYSMVQRKITNKILMHLGLKFSDIEELNSDSTKIVNRSLSSHELKMIASANEFLGHEHGKSLAVEFIEQMPDFAVEPLSISKEICDRHMDRIRDHFDYINERLPSGQKLVVDRENYCNPTSIGNQLLSKQHFDIIFKSLKKRILSSDFSFDADQYLEKNPDVKQAGADPYRHFLKHGIKKARDF